MRGLQLITAALFACALVMPQDADAKKGGRGKGKKHGDHHRVVDVPRAWLRNVAFNMDVPRLRAETRRGTGTVQVRERQRLDPARSTARRVAMSAEQLRQRRSSAVSAFMRTHSPLVYR